MTTAAVKEWIWKSQERFIEHILGENLWEKQKEIVRSVEQHKRTAVRTCHGIGKTRVAADIALAFLYTHQTSMVITTAPTWRQVYYQLWREIRGSHYHAKIELPGQKFLTPRYELGEKWHAVGISTKEPEKFQGYHAPYMLIIADEASGIEPKIFEAIHGIMASGECRLLLLGNPTRVEGEFYDAFHSGNSVYNTLHISAWDTPNLKSFKAEYDSITSLTEKIKFLRTLRPNIPYLVRAEYVADMLEQFGEHTTIYQTRVLGEFPSSDPYQLIVLSLIEAAENMWEELPKNERWWEQEIIPPGKVKLSCDVARYGDDDTVITAQMDGIFAPFIIISKMDTMTIAGAVISAARRYNADVVYIDVIGIGAGVYDRCVEEKLHGVVPVNVAEASRDDHFQNLRAEYYWNLKKVFESGKIMIPKGTRLAGQLSSMKYKHNSRGKLQIESKEEMKKRGMKSPDEADAVMMACIYVDTESAKTLRDEKHKIKPRTSMRRGRKW